MKRIIEIIYNYLLEEKPVPDDLLYEFSQDVKEIVRNNAAYDIPAEFWNFQNYIELFWRGRKYEREKNPALVYQMGQLLSYVNLIRDAADEAEKTISIEDYANRWEGKYLVFKGIHDEYGITHKRLAQVSNLSPSALSQFIAKTKWDGYYTYRLVGREKYYYLTEAGEELYELMKNSQPKEPEEPRYYLVGVTTDNNYFHWDIYKTGKEDPNASYKENTIFAVKKASRYADIPDRERPAFADKKIVKEALYAE